LCRHEDGFQLDPLFPVESFVIGGVKWQKADVGGLNAHPDFFDRRLRVNVPSWKYEEQNQKPATLQHRQSLQATPLL
jgi:hypothetical protein